MAKRRKYIIHRSSQMKILWMAVLPALTISFFSTLSLIKASQPFLEREKSVLSKEIRYIDEIVQQMNLQQYPPAETEKIENLKMRLTIAQNNLRMENLKAMQNMAATRMFVFLFMAAGLLCSALIAVLLSHRFAGPIFRLRTGLDALAQGKDVSSFKFRQYDEFKEVAESFETLRKALKSKGYLSS